MKKYDIIDHTADIGVKAYGSNISEAFENAAKAMFDLITDNSSIENIGQYNIELKSPNIEQLLVDWLSELLFLNSAKNLVFGLFEVNIDKQKCIISSNIFGEEFKKSKHKIGLEIKAITYHMLEVKIDKPYSVQILFDI